MDKYTATEQVMGQYLAKGQVASERIKTIDQNPILVKSPGEELLISGFVMLANFLLAISSQLSLIIAQGKEKEGLGSELKQ